MFELIMGSRAGGFGMVCVVALHYVLNSLSVDHSCSLVCSIMLLQPPLNVYIVVFGIGMLCAISISCAASRATWSFARDKAIPFHTIFAHVNHRLGDVPVYAHLLSTAIQLLLGLIFLGSTAAFNAFTGVAVISLQASYAMPVAISLATRRKHVMDAPFNLGRWGVPLNVIAVLWTSFQLVLFSMPAVIPVTPVSMSKSYPSMIAQDLSDKHRLRICCLCRICGNKCSVVFDQYVAVLLPEMSQLTLCQMGAFTMRDLPSQMKVLKQLVLSQSDVYAL
jgi:amino acid transporter